MITFETQTLDEQAKVDLTPLVDVIFSVIAFMMILINVPLASLTMDIPSSTESTIVTSDNVKVLNVESPEPLWSLDSGELKSRIEITEDLRVFNSARSLSLTIEINKDAPVQRMIDTLDILQDVGVESTQILTKETGREQP